MKPEDQKAFDEALVNRCKTVVTVPQDFEAGWKAACEWRDSQAVRTIEDDPCPACKPNTVCRTPSCGRLKAKRQEPITPPAAQINQQLLDALKNLLESALKYKLEPSDLCVEDAQAALAAAKGVRNATD